MQDIASSQQQPNTSAGQSLTHYPVLSVEILNLDALSRLFQDEEKAKRIAHDLMVQLERQLKPQKASVDSIRGNVLFLSFPNEVSLGQAIGKAIKIGLYLCKKTVPIQTLTLQFKAGLDVVAAQERLELSSVPERTAAQGGQLLASQRVFDLLKSKLHFEAVGPVDIQGEMKTFYHIPTNAQGSPLPPQSVATTEVPSTSATSPIAAPSPATDDPIEKTVEPMEVPGTIFYTPPEFLRQEPSHKQPNVNYNQAIESLVQCLQTSTHSPKAKGQLIGICGEKGMGKTSIIHLARAQFSPNDCDWVGGQFFESYVGDKFPMYFWLELLQNLTQTPLEGMPRQQADEYLNTVFQALFGDSPPQDKTSFIRTVLSVAPLTPISGNMREGLGQAIPHLTDLLHTFASSRPLNIVIEDLQYADAASIELLLQLIQNNLLDARINIILTYTPDTVFVGPLQQLLSLVPFTEYFVSPANEDMLGGLAESSFIAGGWKKLPDTLRAQIVEKGSPLYLEQVVRWLILKGGLVVQSKGKEVGKSKPDKKKLSALSIPDDPEQLILDQYEGLDDLAMYILQVASTLGERFSTNVLNELVQANEHFETVLELLCAQGFIVPETPIVGRFRHHIIWKTIYNSISDTNKLKLHQLIADYFELARLQREATINPILVAYHAEIANNPAKAISAWKDAGLWLANVGCVTGANIAFSHQQNLMNLVDTAGDANLATLHKELAIINIDANPDYAKNLLLKTLSDQGTSATEALELQLFLTQAYERLGQYPHAASTLHRAYESLPAEGNAMEQVVIGSQEMWCLYQMGRYQEALATYDKLIQPHMASLDTPPWQDPALQRPYFRGELARAKIALYQCNPEAFNIIDNALLQCEENKDEFMAIHFRLARGLGFLLKGEYEACHRDLDPMLAEIEQIPNPAELLAWWALIVLMYHCDMGDWQNASVLIPNTGLQAEKSRDYLAWTLCQTYAGKIAIATNKLDDASKLLESAVTVASEHHLSHAALIGWRFVSEAQSLLGHQDKALEFLQQAIPIAQKPAIKNTYETYQLTLTHASVLLEQQAFKEAGQLLESQWPLILKTGYTPLIADVAHKISQLYGTMAQAAPADQQEKYQTQCTTFLEKATTIWDEQGNKHKLALVQQPPVKA